MPYVPTTDMRVVLQVHGESLLVANAGDSRCVVSQSGKAVPMSFDHKPTDAAEHSRIVKVSPSVYHHKLDSVSFPTALLLLCVFQLRHPL